MNSFNLTKEEMAKHMSDIIISNNKYSKDSIEKVCCSILTFVNGDSQINNKNHISIFGSIINEIINKIDNKPFNKCKDINILVNAKNSSHNFKLMGYTQISNFDFNNNIIETGILQKVKDCVGISVIITIINIDVKSFMKKHIKYNFNKSYYYNNHIFHSQFRNNNQLIKKQEMKLNIGFIIQQIQHGLRFHICSNI